MAKKVSSATRKLRAEHAKLYAGLRELKKAYEIKATKHGVSVVICNEPASRPHLLLWRVKDVRLQNKTLSKLLGRFVGDLTALLEDDSAGEDEFIDTLNDMGFFKGTPYLKLRSLAGKVDDMLYALPSSTRHEVLWDCGISKW
jgi:hypothetical protein